MLKKSISRMGDSGSVNGAVPGLIKSVPLVAQRETGAYREEEGQRSAAAQAAVKESESASRGADLLDTREDETDSLLFTGEDLVQLEKGGAEIEGGRSNLIAGARDGSGLTAAPPPEVEVETEDEDEGQSSSSEAAVDFPRYTGQARGYAMLYLMQPEARATVEGELDTLLESGVREVFLGVLCDGFFGEDFSYFAEVLRRLSGAGRIVTLLCYLSNGAAQRHSETSPISIGFADMEPSDFREAIKNDPSVRAEFLEIVRRVKPVFQLNAGLDSRNRNIAVVMLEDNLKADSYLAMRELARSVLGNLVEYVRNPCENCGTGSDGESLGDRIERHGAGQVWKLGAGDGLTLDGAGLLFPWEAGGEGIGLEQAVETARLATARRVRYFGLWRSARQGLYNNLRLHPAERSYEVPTEEQSQVEMDILQAGLSVIEPRDGEGDSGQ